MDPTGDMELMDTEEPDHHTNKVDEIQFQDQNPIPKQLRTIGEIREELANVLGSNYPKYIEVLQDWFGNKSLRLDWNISAPFLVGRAMHVHNELITALLFEACQPDTDIESTSREEPQQSQYHQYQYQQLQSSEFVTIKEEPEESNPSLSVEHCIGSTENEVEESHGQATIYTNYTQDVITLHSSLDDTSSCPEFKPFQIQYKILSPNHQFLPEPEQEPYEEVTNYNGPTYVDAGTHMDNADYSNLTSPIPTEEEDQETDNLITVDAVPIDRDNEVEEFIPGPGKDTRFPAYFVKDLIKPDSMSGYIPNVTHLVDVEYWLKKVPGAYKYFKMKPADPVLGQQPFVTSGATIEGKFYLSAWGQGIKSVSPTAISFALKATKEHIKRILFEVIKSRKAYEITKDGRRVNLGLPRMNPYLLSSTIKRNTDIKSIRYPDPVILPPYLPSDDEELRLHALKHACSYPSNPNKETKISFVDLLHLFKSDVGKALIPNTKTRLKLLEQIYLNSKGYFESLKHGHKDSDDDGDESDSESGEIFPVVSY